MTTWPQDMRVYMKDTRYGVTPNGKVFRLVRIHIWPAGEVTRHLTKRGYLVASIGGHNTSIHRMVAETFIPNPDNKPQVAHNNGQRADNRKDNLRWATQQENSYDMPIHGTLMFGDDHVTRKLTCEQVREIQRLTFGKPPRHQPYHREIAARFNVTRECITRIANHDRWIRATAS